MTRSINQALCGAGISISGQARQHNEDSVLCCAELGLWVIADGMGGHNRGDLASAIAVQSIRQCINSKISLNDAIIQANNDIAHLAQGSDERQGMGTTVVALKAKGFDYEIGWVGDSRAYLMDSTDMQQLSRDHSWVQEMLDAGELTQEEAKIHSRKNVITRCLGHDTEEVEVDRVSGTLKAGQMILLCSDGLTGELNDQQIQQLCWQFQNLNDKVAVLAGTANDEGGRDNISCILIARNPEYRRGFLGRLRHLLGMG